MMHYHGTPITPNAKLLQLAGHNFCVSFANKQQTKLCHELGQSVMLDNGAFSVWKRGITIDWGKWWEWAEPWLDTPTTWCVLPDSIEGDEAENDRLLEEWSHVRDGVPVWHFHESLDRLSRITDRFGKVCFGSSGAYATVGTPIWHQRTHAAFNTLVDEFGRVPWVHMLRGMNLSGDVYPFASVDSTDVARNHNMGNGDGHRDIVAMAKRWDGIQCPARWAKAEQLTMEVTA